MISGNRPEGTIVYHEPWGLFGKIIKGEMKDWNPLTKKGDTLVHVEFDDFEAFCHRKNLIEVEGSD